MICAPIEEDLSMTGRDWRFTAMPGAVSRRTLLQGAAGGIVWIVFSDALTQDTLDPALRQ
jgi:hypothetical protein